jgi:hypothetical protein
VRLYYISAASATLQVVINNVLVTTRSLPSTSGSIGTHDFTVTFSALSSYLRFQAASSPIFIDRINLRVAGSDLPNATIIPTGALDVDGTYPADLDNPHPFYNLAPIVDEMTGEQTGTLTAGGQSNFEFYAGTEEQGQSPTMVAVDGAENTPAYRGSCFFVANTYQVKNGRLGNFSFEIDPGMSDLADVMVDLYKQVSRYRLPAKLADDDLDMSALSGLTVESLVIDSAEGLAQAINDLALWHNFDVIDVGGKIVAMLRGGESEVTIPEAKLAAYEEGQERPIGPVAVTYAPGVDAPGLVNVSFIDPSPGKDFHTSTVPAHLSNSASVFSEDLNFGIGGNAEEAVAVGKRFLQQKQLERSPFEFTTGPEFSHLLPTNIITLALSNATHVLRITGAQAALTGLCKFRAVPEKAGIYTQARSPFYGTGHEPPPVDFPANTFLWLGDLPPLRLEDDRLIKYIAGCRRGAGGWRGYRVYTEELSGQYERILTGDRPAMIGRVVGVLPDVSDPSVFDRTSSLVVDFYYDAGTLASRTEAELLSRPVNVLAVGSGQNIEILQFADATPAATSDPFVIRYTFTTLLRARNNTEYALSEHFDGEPCLVFDDTVHAVTESVSEIGTERNYKAPTVGQALADAPVYENFLFTGNSLRDPAPVNIHGTRNDALDLLTEWTRRSRIAPGLRPNAGVPLGEESEVYEWEAYTLGEVFKRRRRIYGPTVQPAILLDFSNVSDTGTVTFHRHVTSQRLAPEDSYVAATVAVDGLTEPSVGIVDFSSAQMIEDGTGGLAFSAPYVLTAYFAAGTTFTIVENGAVVYTAPGAYPNATAKIRIEIKNNVIRYFLSYENESSLPVYESTLTSFMGRDLRGYFGDDTGTTEQRVKVGRRQYLYTAAEQADDGFTPGDPIKVKVKQVSAVVGAGHPGIAIL